ncbi:MAG: hypothetical protein N2510_05655 [Ignavibacteria bacterium]|nr:hypothetical protein [Ignavibacteria bacterium]
MNIIRYFLAVILLICIAVACSSEKGKKDSGEKNKTQKDTVTIPKDQYRVEEWNTGSKNQIIDLIQGSAEFNIEHKGSGYFKATVMYPDGRILDVLADVNGSYKGKKKIQVPETRAYVLKVETEGYWSVYRQ